MMRVHRPSPVGRAEVILDEPTMVRIDRHVFAFDRHREDLRALGQSTCRSLLLYGAQGNGKTHITRYIAANLPGRTTVLVTPDRTGSLTASLRLAQAFQPSLVILDDVDRIGRGGEDTGGSVGQDRLSHLFTEMDRLGADADILFLLTATHPRALDRSSLPKLGRVDEAIELPFPDAQCRGRLVAQFGASLVFEPGAVPELVSRTEGATAAYLKEMVRRLALAALMNERENRVSRRSVAVVLGEATDSQTRIARRVVELADPPLRRPELRMAVSGGRSADL
jgi:ATP-dependent 26S proteasome regulatory subunit